MNTETVQARAARLVQQEVHLCVSSIVSTLAQGNCLGYANLNAPDLRDLIDQACELALPVDDYEEAAREAGWSFVAYENDSPAKAAEPGYWKRDCDTDEANDEDEDGLAIRTADNAQLACEADDIEPYDREVFEHWAVSAWLAERLIEKGEKVDKDFANLNVWARTTTGQAISADWVIEQITQELHA